MSSRTAELQINKKLHVFIEDSRKPAFGCRRDEEGVFYINLYRLRLSVYGRAFHRRWRKR